MSDIENFIFTVLCDDSKIKLKYLYQWLKRIFLMNDSQTDKIPVFYGSRIYWNAFETFLRLAGREGCVSTSTTYRQIDVSDKLFILIEVSMSNLHEVIRYVNKLRKNKSHGKVMIYLPFSALIYKFPPSSYQIFCVQNDKPSCIASLLLYKFNRAIAYPHAVESFISSVVRST